MRMLIFIIVSALLSGCSTNGQSSPQIASNFIHRQQVSTITQQKYPAKNPQQIALYANTDKPMMPYRIIGKASVSRHNIIGLNRGEATLHDMIKKLAASVGGDGLIDLTENQDGMEATIIQYQRILL